VSVIRVIALVVLVLIVVLGGAVAALRYRKIRRDELRSLDRRGQSTISPPPSPYAPSRAVRLIDGDATPIPRGAPERPRLDPDRPYVFSDLSPGERDALLTPRSRHDARWALERSSHGNRLTPGSGRILLIVVAVLAVLIIAGALIHRGGGTHHSSSTSTTTSTSTTVATTSWPATLRSESYAGGVANYSVPVSSYSVSVTGTSGPVWVVMKMGAASTLEYQGRVAQGASYALTLTGPSTVSLGSPKNASVSVEGHAVIFPTAPTAPLVLSFTPPATH